MNAPDLHVHSGYSTYDGMGDPKAVVDRAVELGWGAVCLTEHGWMGSAPALYKAAKQAGIKPILGVELYVTPDDYLIDGDKTVLKETRHLTALALNIEGYQNLVSWVNASMDRPAYYSRPRISLDQMAEVAPHALNHNVILSGCMGGELCQCILNQNGDETAARYYLASARALFPNFYVELQNHWSQKFNTLGMFNFDLMVGNQTAVRKRLLTLARELGIPVIVTNDSHYQSRNQRRPHIAMLARKQYRRGADAHESAVERGTHDTFTAQYTYWTHHMRPMEEIADTLPSWAAQQSIDSINEIVEEADIRLDPLDKFSYTIPRSAYKRPVDEIVERAKPRLREMRRRHGSLATDRFDYEVDAMREFAHYLLIYSDIIRMCRSQGIYTWTRGSAANSLVNYCLGIHEIDPIHYKLMFERFVNPARAKFPDVDIDIEGHRQRDVAKMVTEYMAEIEGEGNVLPVCTYSTFNNRNAFRIMAEAAGVPKEKIDEYAKLMPQLIDTGMVGSEEEAYELLKDELGIDIYQDAAAIFDGIGGVSQHACAFALGTRGRPLDLWVPRFRIGSSDAVVTQYNMKWIEELGFLKLDLLKLDTLSIMHDVARMLGKDMAWLDQLAMPEPGIYELSKSTAKMLREGRTEGVHSMQGNTQRRGCIDVGVESIEDLITVQALYRPSGTRTGLDKHYVARRHGHEEWQSVNEFAGRYLDETLGIAIFQEQIMEMGAGMGMTGEEIDDLYIGIKTSKSVGRGSKELFEKFEPTFRARAEKMMPRHEADELWKEWEKLRGYTFNRGHATSYGILAAKTATMISDYMQASYSALMGRFPGNPRYLAASVREGFSFEMPDVNTSSVGFSRGSTKNSIRVGLKRINGIGDGAAAAIVRNQPFASVEDLVERVGSRFIKQGEKTNTVELLAAVGALESLGIRGDNDDETDFHLLNCVMRVPRAFRGCKPRLPSRRSGSSWKFLGLQDGVQMTEGKAFVAKLFWIPPGTEFATKASARGSYNAHLLTVIDINGIPFDLTVAEEKEAESKLIKYLAKKCVGAVITAEGKVHMPFLSGGNTGFSLWGISGADNGNPQAWHIDEQDAKVMIHLAHDKNLQRRH